MNFAGIVYRMKQIDYWLSNTYRYCNVEIESDTYVFQCVNYAIMIEREEVFDSLFMLLLKSDIESSVKELLLQTLLNNEDHTPLLDLQPLY